MKKKRITKIIMGAVLALGMCASFIPNEVNADTSASLNNITKDTADFGNLIDDGYRYTQKTRTLELDGDITGGISAYDVIAFTDVLLPEEGTYKILVTGNSTIKTNNPDGDVSCISSKGPFVIEGDKKTTLTLNNVNGNGIGINSKDWLTIKKLNLNINTTSVGIDQTKTKIQDSTVTIKGIDDKKNITGIKGEYVESTSTNLTIVGDKAISLIGDLTTSGSTIVLQSNAVEAVLIKGYTRLSNNTSLTLTSNSTTQGVLCELDSLIMKDTSTFRIKGNTPSTAISFAVQTDLDKMDITSKPNDYNAVVKGDDGLFYIGKEGASKQYAYDVFIKAKAEAPTDPSEPTTPDVPSDTPTINKDTKHTWNKALAKGLSFKIDGIFTEVKGVEVDNKEIAKTSYDTDKTAKTVTLKNEYLNALSTGTHDVAILVDDKRVETTMTIDEAEKNPDATDNNNNTNNNAGNTTNNGNKDNTNNSNNGSNINPTNTDAGNTKGSPNTNVSNIQSMSVMIVLISCMIGLIALRKKIMQDCK